MGGTRAEAQSSQRNSSICHGRGSPRFSRIASEIGKDCLCNLCVLGVLCGRFFGNACSFHLPQRAQSSQRDSESGECRNVGAGFAPGLVSRKWIGPDSPNNGLDHGFGHTNSHGQVDNAPRPLRPQREAVRMGLGRTRAEALRRRGGRNSESGGG